MGSEDMDGLVEEDSIRLPLTGELNVGDGSSNLTPHGLPEPHSCPDPQAVRRGCNAGRSVDDISSLNSAESSCAAVARRI